MGYLFMVLVTFIGLSDNWIYNVGEHRYWLWPHNAPYTCSPVTVDIIAVTTIGDTCVTVAGGSKINESPTLLDTRVYTMPVARVHQAL